MMYGGSIAGGSSPSRSHAGALGRMVGWIEKYWGRMADDSRRSCALGVPASAPTGPKRRPSGQDREESLSVVGGAAHHGTLLLLSLRRIMAFNTRSACVRGQSQITMTKLQRGNLPRAYDAEEGGCCLRLCLSLVMLQLRAITLCSIAVLAISDD